jgi:hypothetical protein
MILALKLKQLFYTTTKMPHAGEENQSLRHGRELPREALHQPHERALGHDDREERESSLEDEGQVSEAGAIG